MKKYMKETTAAPEEQYNGSILVPYHFLESPLNEGVNKEEGARLLLGDDVWDDVSTWV